MKPKILSTKALSKSQLVVLRKAGFEVTCYDAISISFIDFEAPSSIDHAIFTSQNGVASFFTSKGATTFIKSCFCVGERTATKLRGFGQNVVKIAQNATELGEFIAKNYENESFYLICGNRRRDELPNILKSENRTLFELITYKTELKPRFFDQNWDFILFFSPSGVASFVQGQQMVELSTLKVENKLKTMAVCIGSTTAAAAKKYFSKVHIAPTTTVDSVISETVKNYKNDED